MRVYNNELLKEIEAERDTGIAKHKPKPDRKRILSIIKRLQLLLLPDFYRFQDYTQETSLATRSPSPVISTISTLPFRKN